MAADYDELRTEVKESQEKSLQSLQALQPARATSAKDVMLELDEHVAMIWTLREYLPRQLSRRTTVKRHQLFNSCWILAASERADPVTLLRLGRGRC